MASNSTTPRKANGVLSVGGSQAAHDAPKPSKAKATAQGKKVIIRRLPPGMTADEFWATLGEEWKEGNGKVDWTRFEVGEISQDPSNPSYPARCYLHVLRVEDSPTLAEIVQMSTWEDAKHTANDPALVGPPYLENAIYQKIPTTKRRTDPRQGTIDQDPEFIAFLVSLTQDTPPKEADGEQGVDELSKPDGKVTTTPLIEYLKEKKANKAKETANIKGGKHSRHESQGKGKEDSKKRGKESKNEKAEKSADKEKTKEPLKLLTKKAAAQEAAEAAKSAAAQITMGKATEEAAPKSRRANIAAAAKTLQRDLGLSPGSAHRRARQDAAKAEGTPKPDDIKEKEKQDPIATAPSGPSQSTTAVPPSAPTAPKAQIAESSRRSRGAKAGKQGSAGEIAKSKGSEMPGSSSNPKSTPTVAPTILKRKEEVVPTGSASSASTPTPSATVAPPTGPKAATGKLTPAARAVSTSQKKGSAPPSVTPGATRGFVKHANPSQGVTEALLKQAMEAFGTVTFVEIDKKKGFAYVDFVDHDGLVKAITASPVPIAQGTVQVLERKETKKAALAAPTQPASEKAATGSQPDRPKRGGRGRGRRGGANAGNANEAGDGAGSTTQQGDASAGGRPG
ncbi:Uu.00g069350.m01.CDS01 [Anthostomella pinea]|uniref:Uu.00g069350.m01.CDS01 n=1 Tax=Anthostomella pinea TaxID=933095 RepID=A0AAI8VVC1_9PEZI|nr:Uu.00g069350.m01.CDS01 [Anthostomella pinea]